VIGNSGSDADWWSGLFNPEPEHRALRGDPNVWKAMRDDLSHRPTPEDVHQLHPALRAAFKGLVGTQLDDSAAPESVEVTGFAHGGLSSGQVHIATWRERLIPLLVERGRAKL
jgi:hypothetical protein